MSQFVLLNSRPLWGRVSSAREANRNSQKFFPFAEVAEKHGGMPIHLHEPRQNLYFGVCYNAMLWPVFLIRENLE